MIMISAVSSQYTRVQYTIACNVWLFAAAFFRSTQPINLVLLMKILQDLNVHSCSDLYHLSLQLSFLIASFSVAATKHLWHGQST